MPGFKISPALMHTKGSSHLWVVGFVKVHSSKCSSCSRPFLYIPKQSQTMLFFFFGKFFFFHLHTTILCMCACGVIPSHSSSIILTLCHVGQWCRKFIFFLHTIIHMCHLISLTCIQYIYLTVMTSFIHTKPPTLNSWCVFMLLITTLSFPFSLHMPLITTFSSGPWLLLVTDLLHLH